MMDEEDLSRAELALFGIVMGIAALVAIAWGIARWLP